MCLMDDNIMSREEFEVDTTKHNWIGSIETKSGIKFDIENPTVDMVNIEDIAHSLSMICRYNGHVPTFYSVAEHSCMVADWLDTHGASDLAFAGLLHDAAEAYLGDIVRPMKLMPEFAAIYDEMEKRVELVIGEKFGVDIYPMHSIVAKADKAIYDWEVQNIRSGTTRGYGNLAAHRTFLAFYEDMRPDNQ